MTLDPRIAAVTDRIRARSRRSRAAYLAGIEAAHQQGPNRSRLSCGNLAHAFAACGPTDKGRLRADATPNLGIVDAYNDMLSAHQPFETYRSEEHTSELQSLMRISYAVFCLKKKKPKTNKNLN